MKTNDLSIRKSLLAATTIAAFSLNACLLSSQLAQADEPSAFGSGFDVQDFYLPFIAEDITPKNMQKWPYYKHVSAHWSKYAVHGTEKIAPAKTPTKLTVAKDRLDLNT
jgi:hypothetical protein